MSTFVPQKYLTRKQVAELYPISQATLAKIATGNSGPPFYKAINKAMYKPAEVEAWLEKAAFGGKPDSREEKKSRLAPRPVRSVAAEKNHAPAVEPTSLGAPRTGRGRPRKDLRPSANSALHDWASE